MDVCIHNDEDRVKHILVYGQIDLDDNAGKIISNELNGKEALKFSITFFEANIVSAYIAEMLYDAQKDKVCKIYVFKIYLYSYFLKLGVKCKYQRSQCLNSGSAKSVSTAYAVLTDSEKYRGDDEELNYFLRMIYTIYGYDYRDYQKESVWRRIKVCMVKENIADFKTFEEQVFADVELFEQLFQDLSINTTEFFRDPEVFLAIRNRLLPYLASYMHIRIWCVGCSNGKEAYSMAILLDELGLLHKSQIYATDISPYVIEEAKNGLYPLEQIYKDEKNYNGAGGKNHFIDYFDLKGSYAKVKSYLSKSILFFEHSLTEDGSLNEFEFILCRNVMIYFKPELQNRVLKNFHHSLDRNGFLAIGKSEGMVLNSGEKYFSKYMDKEKIYKVRQDTY